MAKKFGATDTILLQGRSRSRTLKKLTGGGPDYAFECVGSGELAATAYRAIRRGGLAVVVGVAKPSDSTSVRTMTLPFEEKTLTGSYFGSCVPRVDFPRMLSLYLAGRLKLEELITRRYSIDEAPQAFADLQAGQERARRDRFLRMAERILVVDDQRTNAEMVSGLLRNLGYQVEMALDAEIGAARSCAARAPTW